MLGRQFAIVHAENHCLYAVALTGCGNDDLFGTCINVTFGFFVLDEETGTFDHDVDAERTPWQSSRAFTHSQRFDLLAIHHKHVVALRLDSTFKTSLSGVVL